MNKQKRLTSPVRLLPADVIRGDPRVSESKISMDDIVDIRWRILRYF